MSSQTPYEQIRFINDVIKDRQEKNQPTFFSIKLDRFGALTPLATKENGTTFYETIIQYLTKYDISALIVELYNGKSHNVKAPFQTFKIVVKRNAEIGDLCDSAELKVTPAETVITTEKHFFSMAEKERQVMMLEFDIKRLQYENEELRKKNKKKKNYITELEAELGKTETAKKNSLGNISLGLAGANALESFAKSSFGLGILKNVFGMKEETLSGLLGTDLSQGEQTHLETKSTATLITRSEKEQAAKEPQIKEEKYRSEIKRFINQFLDSCNDQTLRTYYELIQYLGADFETLQSVLTQIKSYREKQAAIRQNINSSVNSNIQGTNAGSNDTDINDSS